MPKTKDAFALRELYENLLITTLSGENYMPPIDKGSVQQKFYLDDYIAKFNPIDDPINPIDDFNATRDNANSTRNAIRQFQRRSEKIDKHNQLLYKYVDTVTNKLLDEKNTDDCIKKIRRAKALISNYETLERVFAEYIEALKDELQEIISDLERLFLKKFGERLQKARYKKKLSRKEIADRLGMTEGGYGFYERGERELSLFKVYRLAKFLEVSADWLLGIDIR